MIGVFPESYPDELFFSRCARYHERMGYRNMADTARDLFGKRALSVSVDLPAGLEAFVENLPPGHSLSVSDLIDSNTLLPFYEPFVPLERAAMARKDMAQHSSASAHTRLGILTMKTRLANLWYCPVCVVDDRKRFGETYWHRVHQLPGIHICPVHDLETVETDMHNSALRGRRDFFTADRIIVDAPQIPEQRNDPHFRVKLRLAQDAAWLLGHPRAGYGSRKHRERYLKLCFDRGVCTYSGKFDQSFFHTVNAHYSDELLRSLGCATLGTDTWAKHLVHNHRATQHPIFHLLMIHYLGMKVAEFFNLPEERLPFGVGPWPCLNPVCKNFRQDVIETYEHYITLRSRVPRGLFRCTCGFSYARIGPECSSDERYSLQNYMTFGEEWETYVRNHFNPREGGVRELASRLGLAPATLGHQLVRMGILNRPTKERQMRSNLRWQSGDHDKKEHYRTVFLETLKTIKRRTEIRQAIPKADGWLRTYDSEWWSAHVPPRQKSEIRGPYFDWHKRDLDLALAIPVETKRIKDLPGRPVRCSPTLIARRLRVLGMLGRYQEKLPISTQALHEHAETHVDYAVRRIWWAVSIYKELGIIPTKSHLRTKAGITDGMVKQERVIDALNAACEHFQPMLLWCVTEAA